MVDLQTMAKINNCCKVARSLSPDSPELFGGLPIVVLMGDFYQFPPVKGLPLWRQPRDKKEDEVLGKEIWNRFTDVIILDKQMRQAEDMPFRNLLQRARQGRLTKDDINLLNSKSISGKTSISLTCIVTTNSLRHRLNHIPWIQFAQSWRQHIISSLLITVDYLPPEILLRRKSFPTRRRSHYPLARSFSVHR